MRFGVSRTPPLGTRPWRYGARRFWAFDRWSRGGPRRRRAELPELGGFPQDPHDLGAADGAGALSGPPAVLERNLGALELALGAALHAVRLVLGHAASFPRVLSRPPRWRPRSTIVPCPRHGCKHPHRPVRPRPPTHSAPSRCAGAD